MLNPLGHQSSSTNFTGVTQRLSRSDSSQFLSPTAYLPQPSQLRASNRRRLSIIKWAIVTSIFTQDIPRDTLLPTSCSLSLSEACPSQPRATSDHHEQLSSTRMAVKWSVQFLNYRRGGIWPHSEIFTGPSCPFTPQSHFIAHQSFWKNIQWKQLKTSWNMWTDDSSYQSGQ